MAYGILFRNDAGDVVIDQDFQNYLIRDSGTTVIIGQSGSGDQGTMYYHEAALTNLGAVDPMLFVQVGGWVTSGVLGVVRDGSGRVTRARFASKSATGLPYFTAGPAISNTVSEPYGLAIWDSAGRLVFDSGRRIPKLVDITSFTPQPTQGPVNIPHADQANAYYFLGGLNGYVVVRGSSQVPPVTGFAVCSIRQIQQGAAEISFPLLGRGDVGVFFALPARNMVFVAAPSS